MKQRNWKVLLSLFVVVLLLAEARKIPELPNFFSGYVETVYGVGEVAPSLRLAREFYDLNANLARVDLASRAIYPASSTEGTVSIVQDLRLKLQYIINRQYRNCTVGPLPTQGNVYVDPSGRVHALDSNHLFYLVNASQFRFEGNSTYGDGVTTDNWIYTGNFSHSNMTFVNTTVRLSITQSGWSIPTISSISSNPTLWLMSVDGVMVTVNGNHQNISTTSKFYDLSFEMPDFDVFDVSYCALPADSILLSLTVPMRSGGVDYSSYFKSLRQAIVNYTQLYPNQIGQVEVTNNGTVLLTTLLLSNVSTIANVTNRKTAASAYEMIVDNSIDGFAPFQVETSPGTKVAPQVLVARVTAENCSTVLTPLLSATFVPSSTTSSSDPEPSLSPTPSPTMPCSCPVPTTITVTTSISLPCPGPIVPSLPVITTTSDVLQPTITESSSCPIPSPTSCPTPSEKISAGYTKGGVVGLSFGMLFLGVLLTLASLFMGFVVYNHCILRHSDRSRRAGYHNHIDAKPNNAYFQ